MSTKIKKIIPLIVVILVAVPLLTACGGGGSGSINVTLDSFSVQMPSTVKAGQVTFHVSNVATSATHEFLVYQTDLAPDKLPLDSNGNVDVTASGLTKIGAVTDIAPGTSQDLTVTLQPGKYVAFCNLPGHYQAGMYTGFTVQ